MQAEARQKKSLFTNVGGLKVLRVAQLDFDPPIDHRRLDYNIKADPLRKEMLLEPAEALHNLVLEL